jgi:protease-4
VSAANLLREGPDDSGRMLWSLGLSVRPGVEWLSIEPTLRLDDQGANLAPGGAVSVRFAKGINLLAGFTLRDEPKGWYPEIGGLLSLSLFAQDTLAGVHWSRETGSTWAAGVRFRKVREPSVLAGRGYVVRWELSDAPEMAVRPLFGSAGESFLDMRRRMDALARDPKVAGVLLVVKGAPKGWAATQELAASVAAWKSSGKKVVAWLPSGGNREYYIAAQADVVVVSPATVLSVVGVHSTRTFFRRLLDKLGIQAQFVWVGKYKTARETLTRTEPTPEHQEAHEAMLDDVFGQLVEGIAKARRVTPEQVRQWIDLGPILAGEAVQSGMVDRVSTATDLPSVLRELGLKDRLLSDRYPLWEERNDRWDAPRRIGVLVAQGMIVPGRGGALVGTRFLGEDDFLRAADSFRRDGSIAGVLLRVDSPGGSSLASEGMNRALVELGRAKPLVVSMGNMAASGGYYISAPARRIFAMPGTATGSIGIYAAKFVVSGLLDMVGVDRTHTVRGKHAAIYSMDQVMTKEQEEITAKALKGLYDLFVARVAEGRSLPADRVELAAQGRIWSGVRALEAGLVDELGGSLEALNYLRGILGMSEEDPVELVYGPGADFSQRLQRTVMGTAGGQGILEEAVHWADVLTGEYTWAVEPEWVLGIASPL